MAQEFVENILDVHKKYRQLIQEVFVGDQQFIGALDKACTAVINHREPKQQAKAPELVSRKFQLIMNTYLLDNIQDFFSNFRIKWELN